AAMSLWEKLVAEYPVGPGAADFRQHLSWNYGWLTETLLDLGDHADAAKIAEKLPALLHDRGQGQTAAEPGLVRCGGVAEKDGRLPERGRKAAGEVYLDKAKELLGQMPERFPNDPTALNNCAWQMAVGTESIRDGPRAVDLAKRAVDLAPKN